MGFATSITWLFISQAFAGAFGATTATAGAYLADVTPGPDRAHRFGLIGASMGIGIIVGPIAGGEVGIGLQEQVAKIGSGSV